MTFYLIAMTSLLTIGLVFNLITVSKGKGDVDTGIATGLQLFFIIYGLILLERGV